MSCDLISNLESVGFALVAQGGNCRAMVQRVGRRSIVVTAQSGDLPFEDDFLVCAYDGDFTEDPDAPILTSVTPDDLHEGADPVSGLAPLDEAIDRARLAAATFGTRTVRAPAERRAAC